MALSIKANVVLARGIYRKATNGTAVVVLKPNLAIVTRLVLLKSASVSTLNNAIRHAVNARVVILLPCGDVAFDDTNGDAINGHLLDFDNLASQCGSFKTHKSTSYVGSIA